MLRSINISSVVPRPFLSWLVKGNRNVGTNWSMKSARHCLATDQGNHKARIQTEWGAEAEAERKVKWEVDWASYLLLFSLSVAASASRSFSSDFRHLKATSFLHLLLWYWSLYFSLSSTPKYLPFMLPRTADFTRIAPRKRCPNLSAVLERQFFIKFHVLISIN